AAEISGVSGLTRTQLRFGAASIATWNAGIQCPGWQSTRWRFTSMCAAPSGPCRDDTPSFCCASIRLVRVVAALAAVRHFTELRFHLCLVAGFGRVDEF